MPVSVVPSRRRLHLARRKPHGSNRRRPPPTNALPSFRAPCCMMSHTRAPPHAPMDMVVATAARRLLLDAAGAPPPRPGDAPSPPRASFPKLLPVFILFVLLLCFLSIFLLRDLLHFFSLWLRRRRRRLRDDDAASSDAAETEAHAPGKPAGLDPEVLATFPTVRFEEAAAPAECAVCLSEFAAGDAVRLLTVCRHAFHAACIDSWLGAHTTCPVCRTELDAPPRPPGHPAVHQEHDGNGGGRIAVVVDEGSGAAVSTTDDRPRHPASHDIGGTQSQLDR